MNTVSTAKRRKLPTGIQTFSTLRNEGCYYVDKTALIHELVRQGRYYFLSRPRRFGKSLLISTLKSLFEGQEELFRGLDIHPHWDWSIQHPVVRLSFGGKYNEPQGLENNVLNQLYAIEEEFNLESLPPVRTSPERLQNILRHLHRQAGQQVVVLVDEYDKPVLDVLEKPKMAKKNRDYLQGLYGILKDADEHVRFVFVAGVTMFSKTSFSSGLNNLTNISLLPGYAAICGYTDHDLDTVFALELEGLDRDRIRTWYNGYNWLGNEKLYNPFDILLLFQEREIRSHWFATGPPGFLYRLLEEREVSPMELENLVADADLVSNFELDHFSINALLFQSGYLTIVQKEQQDEDILYHLDYPNYEVQSSFNKGLAEHLTGRGREVAAAGRSLVQCLGRNDLPAFKEKIQALLAGIPHPWHDSGELGRYESWYASLLYMSLRTTRVDLRVEETSSHGRSDMVVLHKGQVFVLEFKVVEECADAEKSLDSAIAQIRKRGYADKYRDRGGPIHLIGMVFGRKERNLLEVRAEKT